ncbi:MAG: helix-turn-helix transcriptional regulator [Bacilli bacterium]|nr:helix-turn-helix transcriptional regulator [Bacilli bacterium]
MNLDEKRGKHLAELRIKNNLKQSDLAKMIGYSNKSISKWERGICFPKDTKVLIELTNIFNVSLDELLQGEDSDIECKIIPQSKNKYLNFIIKNRVVFIIILVLLFIFILGFYVLFVYIPNHLDRKVYDKEFIEINDELNGNIYYVDVDEVDKNVKRNITSNNKRKDEKEIHKILLDEGFVYKDNVLSKEICDDVFIYYFEEFFSFKVYDYSSQNELYIFYTSLKFNKFYIEKYIEGRPETFYIENDEIKNCNIENCDNYLDYAKYINYIKNLILN